MEKKSSIIFILIVGILILGIFTLLFYLVLSNGEEEKKEIEFSEEKKAIIENIMMEEYPEILEKTSFSVAEKILEELNQFKLYYNSSDSIQKSLYAIIIIDIEKEKIISVEKFWWDEDEQEETEKNETEQDEDEQDETVPPVVDSPIELPTGGYRFLIKLSLGSGLDVTGRVIDDDLPNFLRSGVNPYAYEQNILLIGNVILSVFRDSDYEELVGLTEPTNITGFKIPANTFILNYTIDFTLDPLWDDLEGGDLYFFGKNYHVDFVNESNLAMNFSNSEGEELYLENNQRVILNGERIDELSSFVKPGSSGKLDKITFEWKTDNEAFVTEEVELVVPGFETLKFVFEGMTYPPPDKGWSPYGNMTLVSV